ncbi:MAG: GAF domain-containing protein [Candidatus Omnitrophica bacterium]|nr:GAF domain-containing protein [Candidatus Omnitrophota bacterium]
MLLYTGYIFIILSGILLIFIFLKRRRKSNQLKAKRQYQEVLRKASLGMGRIKELKHLLKLTVHVVTRAVKVDYCSVYVWHEDSGRFVLRAVKSIDPQIQFQNGLLADSSLIEHIKGTHNPVYIGSSEFKKHDDYALKLIKDLQLVPAVAVLPCFIDQQLIAVIGLGNKLNRTKYSHDDLMMFSILANQIGLAIENAQFYEKTRMIQEQLIRAEKMATIGTMVDGISHQMKNRLHAMGFITGDALDVLRTKKWGDTPVDMKNFIDEMEYSLVRLQDNIKRGGELTEGLLKYSRKNTENYEHIELKKLLETSLEMLKFKIKLDTVQIRTLWHEANPKIYGNYTQLQEVFFNVMDNAYDAMMQRKNFLNEEGFSPKIEIETSFKDEETHIFFRDNGMGVRKEHARQLFTPFFTTKLSSSKKGTGLGLFVIRQIIERNHKGHVNFSSIYCAGSEMEIVLPVSFPSEILPGV